MATLKVEHPTNRPNYCEVTYGDEHTVTLMVAFSYSTPIAYWENHAGYVRRTNDWGPTTGKHFNQFIKKNEAQTLDSQSFEKSLSKALSAVK